MARLAQCDWSSPRAHHRHAMIGPRDFGQRDLFAATNRNIDDRICPHFKSPYKRAPPYGPYKLVLSKHETGEAGQPMSSVYRGQFPVARRSRGICQLCGNRAATEGHHWAEQYPSGDDVTADDLTALCNLCHVLATTLRRFHRAFALVKSICLKRAPAPSTEEAGRNPKPRFGSTDAALLVPECPAIRAVIETGARKLKQGPQVEGLPSSRSRRLTTTRIW